MREALVRAQAERLGRCSVEGSGYVVAAGPACRAPWRTTGTLTLHFGRPTCRDAMSSGGGARARLVIDELDGQEIATATGAAADAAAARDGCVRRGVHRLAPRSRPARSSSPCAAPTTTATPSSPRRCAAAPRRCWSITCRPASIRQRAFVVADTLRALGDLAACTRRRWGGRVVAITGSNGKTTTKEMLAAICRRPRAGPRARCSRRTATRTT